MAASSLPDFNWDIKLKSGNWVATLLVPPYIFRRKKSKGIGLISSFCCTTCEKFDKITYAKAVLVSEDEDKKPTYQFISAPEDHACNPPNTNVKSRDFYPICQRMINKSPTKSIGKVYRAARKEILSGLSEFEYWQVHRKIPSLENCNGNLYSYRGSHYPPEPKSAGDFDSNSSWLLLENKESICKATIGVGNNKRILVFSTNECLRNMAKAQALAGDGTFKSTPQNFKQILIIAGEIIPGKWCPLMYIWCPDKVTTTYTLVFGTIKTLLDDLGLKLEATYFMFDFEIGLRTAFHLVWSGILIKGTHGESDFDYCTFLPFLINRYFLGNLFFPL